MFEVIHNFTKEVFTVYGVNAVNSVGGGYNTLFLFFKEDKWVWERSTSYIPKS